MRRVLGFVVILAVCGAVVVLGSGASSGGGGEVFKVELDNAFGLTEGGDFKVAGVRAGKIKAMELDRKTRRAIVTFEVTATGFGDLRSDSTCSVEPQSLIGEYYIDCQPGRSSRRLSKGGTIPVERTQGTVPPDLVNNIMRRPYRERLSLVLAELGAGVAGNADNLNDALRRAVPALRETNKVLAMLAEQSTTLADLTRDADRVVGDLAAKRTDVTRFVVEARDTARASAERATDIQRGFERLPTFLRELQPSMVELGRTVDEQGPALRNLSASAGQLDRLLRNIPPFAQASEPGIDALGESSKVGREAVVTATPTVAELDRYTKGAPELGNNLAMILEHLDDRDNAVEDDPRSPGGKGYTGLEALLQYVFDQALATNVHDGNVHILKAQPFEGECAHYADREAAKEVEQRCSTALGPNVIGFTHPDATEPEGYDGRDRAGEDEAEDNQEDEGLPLPILPIRSPVDRMRSGGGDSAGDGERRGADAPDPKPAGPQDPAPPAAAPAPAPALPTAPAPEIPKLDEVVPSGDGGSDAEAQESLLDYLLGS